MRAVDGWPARSPRAPSRRVSWARRPSRRSSGPRPAPRGTRPGRRSAAPVATAGRPRGPRHTGRARAGRFPGPRSGSSAGRAEPRRRPGRSRRRRPEGEAGARIPSGRAPIFPVGTAVSRVGCVRCLGNGPGPRAGEQIGHAQCRCPGPKIGDIQGTPTAGIPRAADWRAHPALSCLNLLLGATLQFPRIHAGTGQSEHSEPDAGQDGLPLGGHAERTLSLRRKPVPELRCGAGDAGPTRSKPCL